MPNSVKTRAQTVTAAQATDPNLHQRQRVCLSKRGKDTQREVGLSVGLYMCVCGRDTGGQGNVF